MYMTDRHNAVCGFVSMTLTLRAKSESGSDVVKTSETNYMDVRSAPSLDTDVWFVTTLLLGRGKQQNMMLNAAFKNIRPMGVGIFIFLLCLRAVSVCSALSNTYTYERCTQMALLAG